MNRSLIRTTSAFILVTSLVPCAEAADKNFMSRPVETGISSRPILSEDLKPINGFGPLGAAKALPPFIDSISVVDAVVSNTDPSLKNDDTVGARGEVSIGIDKFSFGGPRVVLTNFEESWGAAAPLWLSTNEGQIWTKKFSINPPPGAAGVPGCPCDQTVDFTKFGGGLAGTFLTAGVTGTNVYSALSTNLTASPGAFNYFTVGGVAQATNHLGTLNAADQPWLLVGRKPGDFHENVYVAYDDFNTAPDMRVAVAEANSPLNFTIDNISGFSTGGINPGHRLAVDPRSGAVYSLFQRNIGAGAGGSKNIDYMLNRSTDGGKTWTLNGSATGIVVANADSTQPTPKFCTVNALLGGVDHATVDPQTGDVVYVYGNRDLATGNNRLAMRRLTPNASGGLSIGPQIFITGQVQAALPSVAITANRTIGVFYYTCDGISSSGFPIFTAHFSTSNDLGTTFLDNTLESFLSPVKDNGNPRQRVVFDYEQVKAVDNTFYGGFSGNRIGFYPLSPFSIIDPIFFKVQTKGIAISQSNLP